MTTDRHWFYTDGFERYGPVDGDTLISKHLCGEIDDNTQVCRISGDPASSNWSWQLFSATELGCTVAALPMPPADQAATQRAFSNGHNPLHHILGYGLLAFALVLLLLLGAQAVADGGATPPVFMELDWERWLFLFYMACYLGMWITYFRSLAANPHLQVPTLRRLLKVHSVHWDGLQGDGNKALILAERESTYQKKASSGISALAMLASASLLELSVANTVMLTLPDAFAAHTGAAAPQAVAGLTQHWVEILLILSALCAFSAFVSFIVAADAFESLFNKFTHNGIARSLLRHFYETAVYPRYFGFAFLIGGALLLVGVHQPLLGAAMVGVVFVVGFPHWFPSPAAACEVDDPSRPAAVGPGFRSRLVLAFVPIVAVLALL